MSITKLSVYISYLLRHQPQSLGLAMDSHGWVSVTELIDRINGAGKYYITEQLLEQIVRSDEKGRYRFSADGTKIKACQGHSISWVEPELTYGEPPEHLYHGTTEEAWQKIRESGYISKMGRHAVHMQAEEAKAWKSAKRWHKIPVVLKIDARTMHRDGVVLGVTDNGVWCAGQVRTGYITEVLRTEER